MKPVRSKNGWSPALAASQCLFRFAWALGDGVPLEREIQVPHDLADAFGGLMLLRDLARSLSGRFAPIFPSESAGEVNGFKWRHWWRPYVKSGGASDRTMTQRIVANLLAESGMQRLESISLAVAVDDLHALASPWGNSLALATFDRASLALLADGEKAAWQQELKQRADRTSELLARRPALAQRMPADMLVSSIGPIDSWPWAPALDPRSLMMVPTPASPRAANIVLWAAGGFQALTVCGKPGHPAWDGADSLERHWRALAP